jgi:hypothetical protein
MILLPSPALGGDDGRNEVADVDQAPVTVAQLADVGCAMGKRGGERKRRHRLAVADGAQPGAAQARWNAQVFSCITRLNADVRMVAWAPCRRCITAAATAGGCVFA